MNIMPVNSRKLLEWLDGVSPLLETKIVAAFELDARQGADAEFCRDEPPRSDGLDHGPRTRRIKQIPRHVPSPARASAIGGPLPLCPLTAAADLFNRRSGMVLGAPVSGLAAGLELHGLDVWPGHDEIALDHAHSECGHRRALSQILLRSRFTAQAPSSQ
jgi:hypothetical protein